MLLNKYFARNPTPPNKNISVRCENPTAKKHGLLSSGWGVLTAKKYNIRDYGWTHEHISSIVNILSMNIIPNNHSLLHDYMSIFGIIPTSTSDKVLENLPASE